jgi:Leucine-rich repeat (LRR) protein
MSIFKPPTHDEAPENAGSPPDEPAGPVLDDPEWVDEEAGASADAHDDPRGLDDQDDPFLDEDDPYADRSTPSDSDEAPALKLKPRWRELEAALDTLGGTPFAMAGSAACRPPVVRAHGTTLSWPLSETGLRELRAACSRSAFGEGGRTRIDPEVRSAWELDPSQFEVEGLEPLLSEALREMARELGEGALVADLYKLLHYEPGDRFRAHRDSVKQPGMIGTLVIGLPGDHEGGELCVRLWGDEVRLRLSSTPERTCFAGFYADCVHELWPIRRGSRTCLSFTVRRAEAAAPPPPWSAPTALVDALESWLADPEEPECVVVPLVHCYPGQTPRVSDLKGRDRSLVQALQAAARIVSCPASFCSLELQQESEMDWTEWHMNVTEGASPPDEVPMASLVWPWAIAFLDRTGGSGWTGNEGVSHHYRYRHAALVFRRPQARPGPAPEPDEDEDDDEDDEEGAEEDRARFEESALIALLARAHEKRWRRLDLDWLVAWPANSAFRGLSRLTEHLEELRAPAYPWMADLERFPALRRLALHGEELRRLPASLMARLSSFELRDVRELRPDTIDAIARATHLRHLDLTGCKLAALPDEIARAPLRSLRLGSTGLQKLPDGLGANGELEELDVQSCHALREIPDSVLTPALRVLHLGSTSVHDLKVASAPSLQRLHLDYCPLTSLPAGLAACQRLESLTLAGYTGTPATLGDLEALKELSSLRFLSIISLNLSELPELPEPSVLEVLDLSHNELCRFHANLGRMGRLRELRALYNRLQEVPDLSGLGHLRGLDLSRNPVLRVPGLSRLPRLEVLDLGGCIHLDLSEVDGASACLRSLDLRGVRLGSLPSWIRTLPEIEELRLDDTGLTAFPITPGELQTLRILHLANNPLTALPRLDLLPDLRDLSLAGNALSAPPPLALLSHLEELDLSSTGLTDFPIEPGDLPVLRDLALMDNPLASMPRVELLPALCELSLGKSPPCTPTAVSAVEALRRRDVEVYWAAEEADEARAGDDFEPGSEDIPFDTSQAASPTSRLLPR